eukprot:1183707-Prorocentrum_minimum.AAC.1
MELCNLVSETNKYMSATPAPRHLLLRKAAAYVTQTLAERIPADREFLEGDVAEGSPRPDCACAPHAERATRGLLGRCDDGPGVVCEMLRIFGVVDGTDEIGFPAAGGM